MKLVRTVLKGLVMLLFVFGVAGCDTLEDLNPFNDEKEVQGVVEAIGDNSLTVDGIAYAVTDRTEFDGVDGLAGLSVGDEVEIDYEERSDGSREALEVELAGADDDDGGIF